MLGKTTIKARTRIMTVAQHLDYDSLNALKEVMEGDFNFLVETFLQDSADKMAQLKTLKPELESDSIRRAAHSFKGSCSNLGAIRLASLCATLEHKALAKDLADFADQTEEIDQEFTTVRNLLTNFLN